MGESLRRRVEKRYREDLRRLRAYWPAEQVTLAQAARGRRSIRLHSGDTHEFDEVELRDALSRVPRVFHGNMRLPITLRYTKSQTGAYYEVLGDNWQARLVELLLTGTYSYRGLRRLTVSQFISLNRRYRTLIFVSITL